MLDREGEAMSKEPKDGQTGGLGEEFRQVRVLHRLTLRQVEEVTGISNAYLSQLETGKIAQPSPNYLYKLAEVYWLPYDLLMEKAGYIARSPQGDEQRPGRTLSGTTLAFLDDVTEEEAAELAAYLAYLRWKSGKTS
jgi:transcriptional regulator with XRE-family HTH domain